MWVEDINRKCVLIDGNLSCQRALSLHEYFSKGMNVQGKSIEASALSAVSDIHWGHWNVSPLDTGGLLSLHYTLGFKEGTEHYVLGVRKYFTVLEMILKRTLLHEGSTVNKGVGSRGVWD